MNKDLTDIAAFGMLVVGVLVAWLVVTQIMPPPPHMTRADKEWDLKVAEIRGQLNVLEAYVAACNGKKLE